MSQPYIFKKQIIGVIFCLLVAIFYKYILKNEILFESSIYYLFLLLSITFIPSIGLLRLSKKLKLIVISVFFYISLFFPLMFGKIDITIYCSFEKLALAVLVGGILVVLKYLYLKFNGIDNQNVISFTKISKLRAIHNTYLYLIPVIGEEIFFRGYLTRVLYPKYGEISLLIISFLFVYIHYLNRWSNIIFTKGSYFFHFLNSLIFCIMYIYTDNLIPVILCHLIFNIDRILETVKRVRKEDISYSFNDY